MSAYFRKSKPIAAIALALSLAAPSVQAAAAVPARSLADIVQAAQSSVIPGVGVTQIEHRRDRRAERRRAERRAERRRADRRAERRAERRREERRAQRRAERRAERRRAERRAERRALRHHYYDHGVRYRSGYRGYRHHRHGYRRADDGWWYPLAAFGLSVIILNEATRQRRVAPVQTQSYWNHIPSRNMAAHDNWCDLKYRSYSRANKTFQPYNGPRKYCNSPYDLI